MENFSLINNEFNSIEDILTPVDFIKTNKREEFANVSCAFDIESTSTYFNNEKCAFMYIWVFGINGKCILGRTWEEFYSVCERVSEYYHLDHNKKLIVYVHNLSYEFQFLMYRFNWDSVFSIDERKPVKALTSLGIEFRCSYILTNYSLAKVSENLLKYPVQKLVGDLDYKLVRHYKTPLTTKEKQYVINDCLVVMSKIQEEIETLGDITRIPLTKTGYVRRYCKNACMYEGNHKKNVGKFVKYRRFITGLTINTPSHFNQLLRAFKGGFTHANGNNVDMIHYNVDSFDFCSSYPYCMVAYEYPMSKGELYQLKSLDDFKENLKMYCCIFDITFYDLEASVPYDHPLSSSKCYNSVDVTVDNGRVISAKELTTTVTELDYQVFQKFYNWSKMRIANFRRYRKGYLPTELVKSILKLYSEKTTLKGVDGKEAEYLSAKENVNSVYGMMVTNPCRDDTIFNGIEWIKQACDVEKAIAKYDKTMNRFLFYAWGIYVTAYARFNLFTGIYSVGNDYIYADTDSIKCINAKNHEAYFKKYNEIAIKRLKRACNYHHIPFDMVSPKTIKGVEKTLGLWEHEGNEEVTYLRFKTLGAKRYMIEDENGINITVSGLNKKVCVPYLCEGWYYDIKTRKEHNSPFDKFKDGLFVPKQYTGKNIHSYIDYKVNAIITDYLGVTEEVMELSSVHIEESEYSLSLTDEYLNYILGLRETEANIYE